jgi:hypothetical protein
MAITSNKQHNKCPIVAVLVTSEGCPHYAKLCCDKHKKHIQWLTEADFKAIVKLTGKFKNDKGEIFDKRQIRMKNGVKGRPTRRQKPKETTILEQYKDGNVWRTVY